MNTNYPEIKDSKAALNKMKLEIAESLGIPDYDKINKGDLPARIHGKIGGTMVKRMIAAYEQMLADSQNKDMQMQEQANNLQ